MEGKFLKICDWKCSCKFCGRNIGKGERYLNIYKNAWKGFTRINICQFCILRIFVELAPTKKEIGEMKRLVILENLK